MMDILLIHQEILFLSDLAVVSEQACSNGSIGMQLTCLWVANAKIFVISYWLSFRGFNISGFLSSFNELIDSDASNHLFNL